MDWLQTLAGAFAGTMLGVIASYRLWLFQRAKERKGTRAQLVAAIVPLLAKVDRSEVPDSHAGPYTFIDPIPLDLLDPLLEIATEEDGGLLAATVALRVNRDKFNALARVANSARARGPLPPEIEEVIHLNLVERRTWLIEAGDRFVKVADAAKCGEVILSTRGLGPQVVDRLAKFCVLPPGHKGDHSPVPQPK